MNQLLDRPADHLSESAVRRIDRAADNVVKHLLMCDEFTLAEEVVGTSEFTNEFQRRGPRDSKGRSLRDFDLQTRLFRYPCSYLVYSPAFDALPAEVRTRVTERLTRVLEGDDQSDDLRICPRIRGGKSWRFCKIRSPACSAARRRKVSVLEKGVRPLFQTRSSSSGHLCLPELVFHGLSAR